MSPRTSNLDNVAIAFLRCCKRSCYTAHSFSSRMLLLLETSVQAQMLIPMASSLAFGVLFATFVCLILVPAAYLILDDALTFLRRLVSREAQPAHASTPAKAPAA